MSESLLDSFDVSEEADDFEEDAVTSDSAIGGDLAPLDFGRLPEATRRVLVQLLRGPYISQERHSKAWVILLRAEHELRESLGDLFLELVVDTEAGLAFIRNMSSEEAELPKVVRSQRLTLIDTALVLFLREQLLHAEATDRRVFIGQTDIVDYLKVYRNASQNDELGFGRRVSASLEKMKKQSVLLSTPESDRFEISPVLRLVFDADQVLAVTKELKRLLAEQPAEDSEDEPENESEDVQ
ncbi:MAG: DUF4194 domain-containing protein [Coriobacteriia bacterium]|nr:DUF4194 domain-containing protein [Coriobacteriia bacterium]